MMARPEPRVVRNGLVLGHDINYPNVVLASILQPCRGTPGGLKCNREIGNKTTLDIRSRSQSRERLPHAERV
jgi:hypothetical protein